MLRLFIKYVFSWWQVTLTRLSGGRVGQPTERFRPLKNGKLDVSRNSPTKTDHWILSVNLWSFGSYFLTHTQFFTIFLTVSRRLAELHLRMVPHWVVGIIDRWGRWKSCLSCLELSRRSSIPFHRQPKQTLLLGGEDTCLSPKKHLSQI